MTKKKNNPYLQGKECFVRMNFLYQASMLMAGSNNVLSSYYGSLCRSISKKSTLKIEPSIKRNLCKRCSLAQKPGVTSTLKINNNKRCKSVTSCIDEDVQVVVGCLLCGYKRSYKVNSKYKFWLENPQSIAEVCSIQTEEFQADDKVTNINKNYTSQTVNKNPENSNFQTNENKTS